MLNHQTGVARVYGIMQLKIQNSIKICVPIYNKK